MTQEDLTKRLWYNRMMNVTARGYRPPVGSDSRGTHVRWESAKWSFEDDCPQEFKDLMSRFVPKPAYYTHSLDPKTGKVCWGYVSVWSDREMWNGWQNKIFYDYPDATSIRFLFEKYVNGNPTRITCRATATRPAASSPEDPVDDFV